MDILAGYIQNTAEQRASEADSFEKSMNPGRILDEKNQSPHHSPACFNKPPDGSTPLNPQSQPAQPKPAENYTDDDIIYSDPEEDGMILKGTWLSEMCDWKAKGDPDNMHVKRKGEIG